jgi:glutamate synthase (ferredoxin)
MTGGVAVVIGPTGRNFAAGMSGGSAFLFDEQGEFPQRCNLEMVDLEPLREPEDIELVRDLLIQHAGYTGSTVAARILGDWEWAIGKFVKVMPIDYRRVLEEQKKQAEAKRLEELQLEVSGG